MSLYKGDNTEAFGNNLLTINVNNITGHTITKAEVRIGSILKTFNNPSFPLTVNLSEEETDVLNYTNDAYIALYDEEGRKKTAEGTVIIKAQKRRV